MSEDARGVKGRTRVLYVANPSSDSDGSEEDRRARLMAQPVYDHAPLRPNRSPPAQYHHPSPLTTNLPPIQSSYHHHPHHHPSSSSPSSTSSPAAEESTPPPITPGLPVPPVDLSGDPSSIPDPTIAPNAADKQFADGTHIPPSRRGKLLQTIKSSFNHTRNPRPAPDIPKRPRTSPTSASDAHSNHSLAAGISGKVLIVVTTDSDWYVTVDISGAKNAVVVRECIFNKLNIRDDDQLCFSIYQTEMGAYAIGEALTDEKLFSLCRDYGDAKGSLKFFVSHSSAPVHEHAFPPHSPTSATIPPPVLPYNDDPTPLRPKRRSRQESISSASEPHPLETAAGYEADLDNPDRDKPKSTAHSHSPHPLPSPPQHPGGSYSNVVNLPPSPRAPRRPSGQVQRPLSPSYRYQRSGSPLPSERPRVDISAVETKHMISAPLPPPLSPNRPTFNPEEHSSLPPASARALHERSGSDYGAEREQPLKASEPQRESSGRLWRGRQHAIGGRLKTDSDSWVIVPEQESTVGQDAQRLISQSSRNNLRQQPSPRFKVTSPYTGRALAIPSVPRLPPPVPTVSAETRPPPPRPAGIPISSKFFVAWRGEERGDQRTGQSSVTHRTRLGKGAKSMDNLRAAAHGGHPAPLPASGARRTPAQLPITRPTPSVREPVPFLPSTAGVPKSYEAPRPPVRPLPVQGSTHSSNLDLGKNMYNTRANLPTGSLVSPNNDPYPRPSSAVGDSMTSPSMRLPRQLQSPSTYGGLDSADSGRSGRGPSPSHPYHTSGSKAEMSYGNRSERPDMQSSAEGHYTTPPRTPDVLHSPAHTDRGRDKSVVRPNGPEQNGRVSESTLTQEDRNWFSGMNNDGGDSTFILPRPVSSQMSQSTFIDDDSDSGGDDFGTSMWKKRPVSESERPKSVQRPPLKVQIQASSGSPEKTSNLPNQLPQQVAPLQSSRPPPVPPSKTQRPHLPNIDKAFRASTFTDAQGSSWAPRPPPEDVYERLEEFFPEHDLDKPVIEANSGGTSPTTTEPAVIAAPPTPAVERPRGRGKKSIRIVAQEHKKLIDRTSRADPTSYSNVIRKRSTKLWGSKLEEVTTAQAKGQPVHPIPESPANGPTTFKWVRGELIGRGTYGRVYLALNATTGEMIAVKQVEMPRTPSDKNDSRQITVVQALKMESETLKDLDHPNIVQYLGFEETPSNLSIFLEYVPGGSIGSCLAKHGKFDENVTKSFTAQILGGLEYLHSKGILHRDLKADNILVEMSGVCKISDFGISKRTDDGVGGAFTAMQGTVFWMAPEVINTQKKGYNFKIDIWSVGCVVLEMWAGMRPWMGDEAVAVMFKLYQSKLPPPVPEGVVLSELADDFRRRCFAINPEQRPSATELRRHPYLIPPPDWVFTDFT